MLERSFYGRNTLVVAKELLGKLLIHKYDGKILCGKIVETEAYTGITDKGAHVYGGKKTPRVMPMYGKEGTVYIYTIYGMYYCLNVITERENEPQGVLIRALEPLIGLEEMALNRFKKNFKDLKKNEIRNLTSGPSKLCMALNINKDLNNTSFISDEFYIADIDENIQKTFERKEDLCGEIVASKRIGIDYAEEAKDYLYRFYYKENPFVSKKDK